jgi:hypothetical protein
VSKLQQANTAARKEMDWQAQLEALLDARRLAAHHAEVSVACASGGPRTHTMSCTDACMPDAVVALQVLRPAARELIQAALPAVEELRSTTARMAIMLFQVRARVCVCVFAGPWLHARWC